uniref:SSD domain-containing protein n=1 Tax=Vitrella brassicaformis TaxID=1169539 RepID=A0A7S1NZT3_9ALVE
MKGRGGKALSGGAIVAGLVVVGLSLGLVKWRVTDGSVSEQLFADNHMFSESFEHFAGWFKGNAGPTYLPVELYWRLPTHTASGSEDKAVKRDWEAVCADFPPTDLPTTLRQMEEVCKTIEEPLKCHDDLLPSCTHPIVAENQSFVVPDTLICPHRSLPGFDPDDVTWADNVTTAELLELKETMPNSVITINGEPTFLAVRFYTTVLRFATYPEMVPLAKYLERWEGELRDQGQQVAVTGGEALEYVNYETLKYFPWEIIFMFLIGMCILLVLLTLTLQNYMLGPMALFSMACAMVVMQGIASMACYGRIGAYEGVNLALSVTHLCVPTLLLAIFYAVASWEGISDRVGRVKAALRGGAPAAAVYSVYVVMAGSLFSVTESVPLMKFGLLALIAAATGLVMAFLIFLPLCVLVGPRGQEYDVRPCWPSSNIKPLTTECESTLP